jgi:peroxiredoxin
VAELQGLGAQLSEAERAGVEIVAISPDPNEQSQKLAEGLRLGYRFLADRDLAVARRYGLVHAGGGPEGQDVPRPATVVLDRDGVVRWFSVSRNFQVRPDPDDVLRAVRALLSPTAGGGDQASSYGRRSATRMPADGAASGVIMASAPSVSIAA